MICPRCGGESNVLATREYLSTYLRRSRICRNGHRFSTFEVLTGNLDRRTLTKTAEAIRNRQSSWVRQQYIKELLRAGWKVTAVAHHTGVTEARVRQIQESVRNGNEDKPRAV